MDDSMDFSRETSSVVMEEEDNDLSTRALNRASKVDDHSSSIASKLLQGWTLLGDHCPVCVTPLVRNRQKQMFCVACDQWVLTEEQLASKLNAQRVNDSKTSSETSTPTPPPPASSAPACSPTMSLLGNATSTGGKLNGGSHGRISSLRDRDQDVEVRSPKRLASMEMFVGNEVPNRVQDDIIAPFSQTSKGLMLPKVNLPVDPSLVLCNTLSTLFQKVEELRQLIAVSHDIEDLSQLLHTLGECMEAIKHTKAVFQLVVV
ncbi:unnamed protein product [Sphagnum tenellum]